MMRAQQVFLAEGPELPPLLDVLASGGARALVKLLDRADQLKPEGRVFSDGMAEGGPGDEIQRCAYHSATFFITTNKRNNDLCVHRSLGELK